MNQKDKIEESISKEWEKLRELMMDFYRGDADFEEIMLSFKVWARQFNKELATQIKTQEREKIINIIRTHSFDCNKVATSVAELLEKINK